MTDHRNFAVWHVAASGYLWERQEHDWFLRAAPPTPEDDREYFLMEKPGLFQRLGRLRIEGKDSDREAILEFAKDYGHLGIMPAMDPMTFITEARKKGSRVRESLSDWRLEVGKLRVGIDLWEGINKNSTKLLSKYLTWRGDDVLFAFSRGWGAEGEWLNASRRLQLAPPDLFLPGWYVLQGLINGELARGVSPQVLWETKRPKKAPTVTNPKESLRTIRDVPRNLLAACWLQFARAFEGDRSYKQCEAIGCKNWFEIKSAAGNRDDRRYCSDYCRVRAHRIRKAKGESR